MASKSGRRKTTGPEDGSPGRRRVSMGKCAPDAPSMTGDSRFPVSMSGLSGSPKRDASARSIPVPGGELAKSIASGKRRTPMRGARSYQLKCEVRDAEVNGLTKKCAKQSEQRARPGLLWLMEIEDNGGMGLPVAKRHNCGADGRAQLAKS